MIVRSFDEPDRPALVALSNTVGFGHPATIEESRQNEEAWDRGRYQRARFVAVDPVDRLVGWAELAHTPWQFHVRKYHIHIEVLPDRRRHGIGSQLLERLLVELRERDALLARTVAIEGDEPTISFLADRGFNEVWRNLHSRLDLSDFDLARFSPALERFTAQGFTVSALTDELKQHRQVLDEVYEVAVISGSGQDELDTVTPPSAEEFGADLVEAPRALPQAAFLARHDGRLVGISTLERVTGSPALLEAGFTTVSADYRRRGIAFALKLHAIEWARAHGYRFIETNSNAGNERMLSINAALGFRARPARITFERRIAATQVSPALRTANLPLTRRRGSASCGHVGRRAGYEGPLRGRCR